MTHAEDDNNKIYAKEQDIIIMSETRRVVGKGGDMPIVYITKFIITLTIHSKWVIQKKWILANSFPLSLSTTETIVMAASRTINSSNFNNPNLVRIHAKDSLSCKQHKSLARILVNIFLEVVEGTILTFSSPDSLAITTIWRKHNNLKKAQQSEECTKQKYFLSFNK